MKNVAELVAEATGALARLDADALERLEARALELRALQIEGVDALEATARLRVFAGVLRETERGLTILGRLRGGHAWGR